MTRIRTNGTLITAELARDLKAAGLGGCLVDVMGAHAATPDGMTGTPGSFGRVCAGSTALLDDGIQTENWNRVVPGKKGALAGDLGDSHQSNKKKTNKDQK